jgi:hypothetical protein
MNLELNLFLYWLQPVDALVLLGCQSFVKKVRKIITLFRMKLSSCSEKLILGSVCLSLLLLIFAVCVSFRGQKLSK